MITVNSIEQQIAVGLLVKQNLFDGVLSDGSIAYVDFSSKGRSQFILQIESFLAEQNYENVETQEDEEEFANQSDSLSNEELALQEEINPAREELEPQEEINSAQENDLANVAQLSPEHHEPETTTNQPTQETQAVELEQVMNNGMQFLAGLFKMSTGKDLGIGNQKIEIDKDTGEIVMRFKLG
jgi:hypothetical protein